MRIRLTGTRAECEIMIAGIREAFEVRDISSFYPNRGETKVGRVYIDVEAVR